MRHAIFVAMFAVGVPGTVSAGSEKDSHSPRPEITRLKEMYLRTVLVAEGRAACAIVPPADPAYRPLAQKLAEAVKQACGAAPPIRAAEEVARQLPPGENVIALGVFANNRVVEDLYLREFVQCDYNWPGGEISYEIRTVHNPWLNGKNVIYLGSTRLAGCQAAVDRFVQVLAERPGGSVGSMIEVMKDGQRPTPPTDQEVTSMQKRIKLATTQAAAYGSVSTCANNSFITGQPAWAKLFVQALRKTDELQRTQASVAGTGGFQYAFHCFDCIEEGPAFTDEERLEVTNLLYRFAARLEEAKPDPKWSALTRSVGNWSMAAAFAAQYFSRYYPDLELSKRLLANVDGFYAPDMAAWKPAEDCPYYGQVTVVRSFKWALHRPDRRYVENGSLRKMADYFMLITNNLGERSGFGDYSGLGHGHQHTLVEVYPLAAWLYRDGRYLWWWDHFAEKPTAPGAFWRYRGQGLMGWVPPDVLPRKRPDDLLGIARAPLDEWLYQRRDVAKYLGRTYEETHRFPIEDCYDKVTFRANFDPEDQYLCMSGLGWGYHSHPHANAIINYSDKRTTMLYDDGYMVAQPSEHNTMIVLKDGMMGGIPELAEVRAQADFRNRGLLVSRLNDYSGVDWDRVIIWPKSRYFLVVDDLQAKEPGSYTFQCIWRTLGKADLQGRRWVSENPPGRFNLIACSDAGLTQKSSAGTNLNDPPFPIDQARRLVQSASLRMHPGESYQFANLFYGTPDSGPTQRVDAYRVGKTTTYLVEDDGKLALAGIPKGDVVPGLSVEGAAFHLLDDTLTVAGATRVAVGGPWLVADVPVSVQANLRTGETVVAVKTPAQVTLVDVRQGKRTERLQPGTHALKLRPLSEECLQGIARELQATRARVAVAAPAPEKPETGAMQGLRRLWEYHARSAEQKDDSNQSRRPNAVRIADVNGDGRHEVFVAGTDHAIHALAPDGRRLWRYALPDVIHDLTVTADRRQILVACNDSKVYSLTPDGSLHWSVVPPVRSAWLGAPRQVQPVVVFDAGLKGDGRIEVIVGVNKGLVYAYDDTGKLLWNVLSSAPHSMTCGTAFDLDGDGRKELIMGNTYGGTWIYSSEGDSIGRAGGSGHAGGVAVACADVDGDGQGEIAVGDKLGKIWLQKIGNKSGKVGAWWSPPRDTNIYDTGSDITAVAMGDVHGDGKLETVVASKNFLLYLFDSQRQPVWHVNLGDVCLDIDVADVTGDGRAEIIGGCEDGTVKVVDGHGKVIAWYRAPAAVCSVRACELDGKPDTKEIVASCEDGSVFALQMACAHQ